MYLFIYLFIRIMKFIENYSDWDSSHYTYVLILVECMFLSCPIHV